MGWDTALPVRIPQSRPGRMPSLSRSAQQAGFALDEIPCAELSRGLMKDGGVQPALVLHALKTFGSPRTPSSADAMELDHGLWSLDETKV